MHGENNHWRWLIFQQSWSFCISRRSNYRQRDVTQRLLSGIKLNNDVIITPRSDFHDVIGSNARHHPHVRPTGRHLDRGNDRQHSRVYSYLSESAPAIYDKLLHSLPRLGGHHPGHVHHALRAHTDHQWQLAFLGRILSFCALRSVLSSWCEWFSVRGNRGRSVLHDPRAPAIHRDPRSSSKDGHRCVASRSGTRFTRVLLLLGGDYGWFRDGCDYMSAVRAKHYARCYLLHRYISLRTHATG